METGTDVMISSVQGIAGERYWQMNYERLKTFLAVTEKKNFSEAARTLHMTQPSVTSQIKGLEEELNTKLFRRTTKQVSLTQSGNILVDYAKQMVHLGELAQKEIREMEENTYGELRIGCSLTVGEYFLPTFLKHFRKRYPLIRLQVEITNSTNIVSSLKDHNVDVGLIETVMEEDVIHVEPFWEDELVLITERGNDYSVEKNISIEELKKVPLIMREEGSGTRAVISQHLKRIRVTMEELNVVMELGSTEAIKSAVEAGLGASIISKSAIKKEEQLQLIQLYTIKQVSFNRFFYIVTDKRKVLSSASEVFIDGIKQIRSEQNI
ncbi:selenium metabolism-associated LysR family transcriptional regulator [Oceanobacillus kimchii]|uniref:selenium metabolism-associated LysR family transcriptional regulator n=1 Tax=Oceanobacillus kimchii TaxID=746691 RepID=UPI003B02A595